jgi:RNA ligase (TIGR02306 family)
MSTFRVPFVRIGKIGKHPNADSLSITTVEGCPVIFKTGDFSEGQAAIYVPVDAVVPETVHGTEFLGKRRRIKAMRLRGIFSMGLLLDPEVVLEPMGPSYETGTDLAAKLGIIKYEEPEPVFMQTDAAAPPPTKTQPPVYDMESYRKYKHLLVPGEDVIVMEKIHGTNSRFVYIENDPRSVDSHGYGDLHVGSHRGWKKCDERNLWWQIADKYDLENKLSQYPGLVFYGETYGTVQDLKYGLKTNEFAVFDIYDSNNGRYLDWEDVRAICTLLHLPIVPVLYMGPYDPVRIETLCDGNTLIAEVPQIREGIVIKPSVERWNNETGRTIFKLISEDYLLRKGGTEFH